MEKPTPIINNVVYVEGRTLYSGNVYIASVDREDSPEFGIGTPMAAYCGRRGTCLEVLKDQSGQYIGNHKELVGRRLIAVYGKVYDHDEYFAWRREQDDLPQIQWTCGEYVEVNIRKHEIKCFQELKDKHRGAIMLIKGNDCYETYNEDAKTVAEILGLHVENDKLSFPVECLDSYLHTLIRSGHRVAIAEIL